MVFISPFNTNRCCIDEFNKKLIKQKQINTPSPTKRENKIDSPQKQILNEDQNMII